jgi:hypothetical protein
VKGSTEGAEIEGREEGAEIEGREGFDRGGNRGGAKGEAHCTIQYKGYRLNTKHRREILRNKDEEGSHSLEEGHSLLPSSPFLLSAAAIVPVS